MTETKDSRILRYAFIARIDVSTSKVVLHQLVQSLPGTSDMPHASDRETVVPYPLDAPAHSALSIESRYGYIRRGRTQKLTFLYDLSHEHLRETGHYLCDRLRNLLTGCLLDDLDSRVKKTGC